MFMDILFGTLSHTSTLEVYAFGHRNGDKANVKIKVQNLFAITKRLEMTLSEVKVKISQVVVQGVAELLRKLSTNRLGTG